MKKITRIRFVALVAVLSLLAAVPIVVPAPPVWASTLSDLEAQLKDLQAQEKDIKSDLAAANSDLSASKKRKELLESQIANATAQIDLYQQQISATNAEISAAQSDMADKESKIAKAEKEIKDKEQDIQDIHDQLGERLRTIAKTGNLATIQRLFNTQNYAEYLLKSKAAECIAKRDQAMMDHLENTLKDIRKAKKKLESQKNDIADRKADLESKNARLQNLKSASDQKKAELDTLSAAVQSEIRNLQNSVSSYNDELAEVRKGIEKADAAIEQLIKNTQSTGSYDRDMMFWPVPAVRSISSYYGPRWGTMHRGLDIANGSVPIYGQNIYAAADGVVIAVNYTSSWGSGWSYGYGYCVLVDHGLDKQGRKITTMYAHCSKMYAREGQKVVGGQTILGQAGSTGDVTGPHLHFEVRVDSVRVNPYPNYVHPDVNIPEGI